MLKAGPLEKYYVPKYPTASSFKPEVLRNLPNRWQRSKKVLLCIGAAGTLMLTGCPANGGSTTGGHNEQVTPFVRDNMDRVPFFDRIMGRTPFANSVEQIFVGGHLMPFDHGGAAMSPMYVATFTEQEAIDIIKREALAAGLNLTVVEPERSFEIVSRTAEGESFRTQDVPIVFVDEDRAIAIAYIHEWSRLFTWDMRFFANTPSITEIINHASPEGTEEAIAVFVNPIGNSSLTSWGPWRLWSLRDEIVEYVAEKGYDLSPEQMEELIDEMYEERLNAYMNEFIASAFNEVEERLILQVRDFVEWLDEQGIMDVAQ